MMVLAAIGAAGTTLVAKASSLCRAPYEKTLFYQLAIAVPVSAFCVFLLGEQHGPAFRPHSRSAR